MGDTAKNESMAQHPVAIIGFGTAGMNAAIALRGAGYKGQIDVFSDCGPIPYSPILTSYYVSGEKSYDECFPWLPEEIEGLDLNIRSDSAVKVLDVENHFIETDEGRFPYSKCVIATGSRPLANGFPKDCGYEPLMLRSMKDAEKMKERFEDPKCQKVLISGASMVALKTLEAALANGLDCTLVGMNLNILDFNALPQVAKRFEQGLEIRGVNLRLGQTIEGVTVREDSTSKDGGRLEVAFSNGEKDSFDEICVAHGMACNLDFIDDGALEMGQAILVDEMMRSSNPDVYAAGDVAQALELVSGQDKIVGIWKNAVNQGQIAGNCIASELLGDAIEGSMAYKGSILSNTIAVDGMLFISGGTIDLEGGKSVEVREDDNMILVCIYDPSRSNDEGDPCLVGFNLASDTDEAGSVPYDVGAMLTMRIEKDCAIKG